MSTVQVVLLVTGAVTALLMLGAARRKLTGEPPARESVDHPSVSGTQYRLLGYLEVLAVIGIVLGIWCPAIGLAAGIGVVALMVGALGFHVRYRHSVRAMVPALVGLAAAVGFSAAQDVVIWG